MSLLPPRSELPAAPRRIVLHWSGGRREASAHDRDFYHVLVEDWHGKYRYAKGVPVSRNMQSVRGLPSYQNDPERGYAPHTSKFNSHSIGFSVCGMWRAVDARPAGEVDPGPSPITEVQMKGLVALTAHACRLYRLEPTVEQVFTHYEAETVHGVEQDDRWDISWLPDFTGPRSSYGPEIRRRIVAEMREQGGPPPREGE